MYLPDVLAIAGFYPEWFQYGAGIGNYMTYGDYSGDSTKSASGFSFPRGIILGCDLATVLPLDPNNVTEYITRSWYEYPDGDQVAKHPAQGATDPKYSGPKPPYEFLKTDEKYSWLKLPRYNDKPMEVRLRTCSAFAFGTRRRLGVPRRRSSKPLWPCSSSRFRHRRICRELIPINSAACHHLIFPAEALNSTSCNFIARSAAVLG